jgi:hypothetical protein
MVDERELNTLRREARSLQRAAAAGDPVARQRAAAVLGARADARFLLANALHVVARERGASSWPALVAEAKRGRIATALDEALDADGRAEIEVDTDFAYPDGSPVVIAVKRRHHHVLLDDRGEAVRRAGRRTGWRDAAERAVLREGMNLAPETGAVFVPGVIGRDLDGLALRLARSSLDVLEVLFELE